MHQAVKIDSGCHDTREHPKGMLIWLIKDSVMISYTFSGTNEVIQCRLIGWLTLEPNNISITLYSTVQLICFYKTEYPI